MRKKMRYYRTAALLGPQEQHVAFRATSRPVNVSWKTVAILAIVVGIGLWLTLGNAWFLMWEDMTVTGVTSNEVITEIKETSDLLGYHRFFLRPQTAVEPLLAAMPQFEAVDVHCGIFPTKCEVTMTPRSPVLAWTVDAQAYWVDAAGVAFPPQGERPDLPVVTGPAPADIAPQTFVAINQGIQSLSALGAPIAELGYSPQMGIVWTDQQGCRVAFGVGADMAPRWQAYHTVIQHCAAQGIAPQAVDVRFPSGASYSLERTW